MENNLCHIALLQTSVTSNVGQNISNAEKKIRWAFSKGAQIICLPELFSTPYFPQHIGLDIQQITEPLNGPFTDKFRALAKELQIVLVLPFCECDKNGIVFNSAVIIDTDGSISPPYHKIHIPQDPFFYEKSYFYPGEEYLVYPTRYGNLAVLICYDQWFPEAARCVALMGADIIFYPTAIGHIRGEIPGEGNWKNAWQLIQRSHAIVNSIPVAAVNRCGWEGELFFFGGSFVCDAFGTLIVEAGEEEQVLFADIDLTQGPGIREGWGFFRNRRIDTYHSLTVNPSIHEYHTPLLTPENQGYHMPAEWEPHEAVFLAWPHNDLTFPHLEAVEEIYLEILTALQKSEPVELLVSDSAMQERITHMLNIRGIDTSFIQFHQTPYSDVWIRDYGPTFLVNHALHRNAAVFWDFNAWGNKYDELIADGKITRELIIQSGLKTFLPGIILEGGSIDVNGRGTVLTTGQCLLHPNRNPSLKKEDIEQYLISYLCAKKIIWLNEGITGDDTDGHIDDIARFVDTSTVFCALEDDIEDANFQILQENYQILLRETDQDGNPLTVIPLPMPHPVTDEENRYPASYLNFYISNTVVLVPVFDDSHDLEVLDIIQNYFPDRKIIGICARAMVEGFGTFHCATQQKPRV